MKDIEEISFKQYLNEVAEVDDVDTAKKYIAVWNKVT